MRLLLGTILIVLLLLAAGKAGAQSLSVVNHTGCSLRFAVGVAAGNPCGSVCYREERLPPLTTIKWPATQMTDWGCDTTRLYWHSFYLAQDHQTKIGQCNLPASATVTTTTCGTALTLSWRVTKEGYIEVSIDSTGNKAIPTKAEKLYPARGGTALFINTVLAAGLEAPKTLTVQTNTGCIAGVYRKNGTALKRLHITQVTTGSGYEVCVLATGSAALIYPGCVCTKNQVFDLPELAGGEQLVYTISQQ
jgi:hypothetical protein